METLLPGRKSSWRQSPAAGEVAAPSPLVSPTTSSLIEVKATLLAAVPLTFNVPETARFDVGVWNFTTAPAPTVRVLPVLTVTEPTT